MSIFAQATKSALRFKSANGLVSTEDLWSLSLAQLDVIAKGIRKELRDTEDSFITVSTKTNDKLNLQFEVVKAVITSKLADKDAADKWAANSERKQVILAALEQKKTAALAAMSVEDLEKELKNM